MQLGSWPLYSPGLAAGPYFWARWIQSTSWNPITLMSIFNITLLSVPESSKGVLPLRFCNQYFVCMFISPMCSCYCTWAWRMSLHYYVMWRKVHIACAEMYFTINKLIIIAAFCLLVAALCCISKCVWILSLYSNHYRLTVFKTVFLIQLLNTIFKLQTA